MSIISNNNSSFIFIKFTMKKIFQVIGIVILTIFSFIYTNKVIELSNKKDPLMIKLKEEKSSLQTKPVNAVISKGEMLVGKSGKEIDINASYEKMKQTNSYNKALLEYIDIKPSIKKKDNYDKPITGVNTNFKELSLIFKIESSTDLNQITYILAKNNVIATFFIDGKILEEGKIKFSNNIYFGLYSYNNVFNNTSISYMKNYLSKTYNYNYSNYCLYKDEKFLNICENFKINTIKPKKVEKNIYSYFKTTKENGLIYEINVTKNNIKQLNSTLIYLKEKGYQLKSLDELLKE